MGSYNSCLCKEDMQYIKQSSLCDLRICVLQLFLLGNKVDFGSI